MVRRIKVTTNTNPGIIQGRHTEQGLANKAFYNQMLLASNGVYVPKFGADGKQNVKAFWAATKPLWQGKPVLQRLQAVLDGLQLDSLEEAYDYVYDVNTQKKAELRTLIDNGSETGWTDAQVDYAESVAETDGTPAFASVTTPKHAVPGTRIGETGKHATGKHAAQGFTPAEHTAGYTPKHAAGGKHADYSRGGTGTGDYRGKHER